jgi:hypothetical protein
MSSNYLTPQASCNEVILTAQLAVHTFLQSLDVGFIHHKLTDLDFQLHTHFNPPVTLVRPGFAQGLWYSIQHLAKVILCAGNGYIPGQTHGNLPLSLPKAALDQVNLPSPTILLTLQHGDVNPIFAFPDEYTQKMTISSLQYAGMVAVQWILLAMERSGKFGEDSLWNWESVVDLKPMVSEVFSCQMEEELNRIRETGFLATHDSSNPLSTPILFQQEPWSIGSLRNFLCAVHNIFPVPSHGVQSVDLPGLEDLSDSSDFSWLGDSSDDEAEESLVEGMLKLTHD